MQRKSRRAKACDISPHTRAEVAERDGGLCVLCGRMGSPNAHFIPRSAGGLGIARNIVTLCHDCHRRYDQTANRPHLRRLIRAYLQSVYADWNENDLYYGKGSLQDE